MRKPTPLTPQQAKNTFINRFGNRVDRLRQICTRFGLRPYRVYLVWAHWSGAEPGVGTYREVKRTEILPTPKVTESVSYNSKSVGKVPDGSYVVRKISPKLTEDQLNGTYYPEQGKETPPNIEFYYEIVEDGRGDYPPIRRKCYLKGPPFRMAGKLDWSLTLMRIEEDNERDGQKEYPE